MEATIDRFGRIVIPKELRDIFGLKSGSILQIITSNDEITLKPVEEEQQLTRKNGILVITAETTLREDIVSTIKNERNSRIQHLLKIAEEGR